MKVFFRADASVDMGSGHVMRCLTLAGSLREKGADVSFICRELPGNLCGFIESKGFKVHRLPAAKTPPEGAGLYEQWLGVDPRTDAKETGAILSAGPKADWLIVDHYALDKVWEGQARPLVKRIMVIDDLAASPHDCDLLLNQNLIEGIGARYDALVPEKCKRLLGPKYALLRPEFMEARKKLRPRDGRIRRILVFFGGSDPANETMKALRAIKALDVKDISVDVVVGGASAHKKEIEGSCSANNYSFYCQTDDMAGLMAGADIAIGAGGSAAWERCCLGLPSIVVIIAENQAEIAANLDKKGAAVNIGQAKGIKEEDIKISLEKLIANSHAVKAMALESMKMTDGSGIDMMLDELSLKGRARDMDIRAAKECDMKDLYEWRNSPEVRQNSFNSGPLTLEEHERWFREKIKSEDTAIYIACIGEDKIGSIRFEDKGEVVKVSVMLNRLFAGRGLGSKLIAAGTEKFVHEKKAGKPIVAEIKKDNIASLKAFERAGFKESFITYIYKEEKSE